MLLFLFGLLIQNQQPTVMLLNNQALILTVAFQLVDETVAIYPNKFLQIKQFIDTNKILANQQLLLGFHLWLGVRFVVITKRFGS